MEDQAEVFNKVNVSTAIHRVARLATTDMPGVAAVDARAVMADARFATLVKMVEEKVDEMAVVSVSNVLWALARLRYPSAAALTDKLAGLTRGFTWGSTLSPHPNSTTVVNQPPSLNRFKAPHTTVARDRTEPRTYDHS